MDDTVLVEHTVIADDDVLIGDGAAFETALAADDGAQQLAGLAYVGVAPDDAVFQAAVAVDDGVVADHARPLDGHAFLDFDSVAEIDRPDNACIGGNLDIGAQDQVAARARALEQGRSSAAGGRCGRGESGGRHCFTHGLGQPDFTADKVGAGAHIFADGADVTPVAFGHVGLQPLSALQESGEELGGKVVGGTVGDEVQYGRFEHVDAGVHPVRADGAPVRFFEELGDAAVFVANDCAVFERVGNGIDGDGGESADGEMVLDGGLKVEVGEGVAADDEEGVVEMGGGVFDTASGAERHLLDDIGDIETEGAAVTVEVLDHGGQILEGDDDLGNAVVFEQLKNMTEDRLVDKRDHRLGAPNRQGTQAGAFTAGHDYGFHSLCPVTVGQWSVARGLRWPLVKGSRPLPLYGRPGIVSLVNGRRWVVAGRKQLADAAAQGVQFGSAEKQAERAVHGAGVDEMLKRRKVGEQAFLDSFAGKLPDNGAQLVLMMEADAVVDGPHMRARRFPPPAYDRKPAVMSIEAVAGLAVGVVDEVVEECEAAQGGGIAGVLAHIEVVYVGITLDEELDAAGPARSVAEDGGRYEAPTEGFADDKGGGFALAEGAGREIPERIFAASRFVDGGNFVLMVMYGCQEGVVGAVGQETFFFNSAFCQRAQYLSVGGRGRAAAIQVAAVVFTVHPLFDRLFVVHCGGKLDATGSTVGAGALCGAAGRAAELQCRSVTVQVKRRKSNRQRKCVAVGARAEVPFGLDDAPTQGAVRAAGGHDLQGMFAQGAHLCARCIEAGLGIVAVVFDRFGTGRIGRRVRLACGGVGYGLCDQDHEVLPFIVPQPELSDAKGRLERFAQTGGGGLFLDGRQVGAFLFELLQQLQNGGCEGGHLLFLHDEGGHVGALAGLQKEGTLTGASDGVGDDSANWIEVEGKL